MINDRQFFITKEPFAGFEDWKIINLHNGYALHYHKGLNIIFQDKNILLLGYAWQVDPNRNSPKEELQKLIHLTTFHTKKYLKSKKRGADAICSLSENGFILTHAVFWASFMTNVL